jgi:hypothetical protein
MVAGLVTCGLPRLPAPPYVRQPTSALAEVPFPPPPARIESVPRQPEDRAVWVDGEWIWQTRRYAWKPGRWVIPPAGARFAPWATVRDARGTLYLARGTGRDDTGAEVPEPPPLATGVPGAAAIVSPEGKTLPTGPIVPADGGSSSAAADAIGARAESELDASRGDASEGTMIDASIFPAETSVEKP